MNPPKITPQRVPWWPATRKFQLAAASRVVGEILLHYPPRPEPPNFMPLRTAIMALLPTIHPIRLIDAAARYAVETAGKDPTYKFGAVRFYRDGIWERYAESKVFGMTRQQWIASRQDVAEFDRLAANPTHYTVDQFTHLLPQDLGLESPYADQ